MTMNLETVLTSLAIGVVTGVFYGFTFIPQKLLSKQAQLSKSPKELRKKSFISFFVFSTVRVALIGALWFYVLRTETINIILVLLSFLISFWRIILKKKVKQYGQR